MAEAHPASVLGKRPRDIGVESAPSPTVKSRKAETPSESYPTPELTQQSASEPSSGGEHDGLQKVQPKQSKYAAKEIARSAEKQARADAAQAKTKFLGDLSNFVPLGSLTVRPGSNDKAYIHNTEWTELSSEKLWELQPRSAWEPTCGVSNLLRNGLARVFGRKHQIAGDHITLRVYILPDDVGGKYIDKYASDRSTRLTDGLGQLIDRVDISSESWEGCNAIADESRHYNIEANDDDSLFYLFNTISSPKASLEPLPCQISNDAIESVLRSEQLPGLNIRLYPYQKRTVATMIQREVKPGRAKDPRFQALQGPTGQTLFYDKVAVSLLRDGRDYEEARGGILGESMGFGKTMICLATILATQGNWPEIPPEYSVDLCRVRPKVGSLVQMAAAAVGRTQIPWRALLREASRAGEDHRSLNNILEDNVGSYVIPPRQIKYSRRSSVDQKGRIIRLSTATLIIVPQNLLSQWRSEIALHVVDDHLQILCLDLDDETSVPTVKELSQYDVILMSKPRFEREMVPNTLMKAASKAIKAKGGCRCSLDEDCHCSRVEEYHTPLKDVHWLRIIMDEGHDFSSSGKSGTIYWALRDLRVDRKWIVSGTPANGLMGVEVGTAINETPEHSTTGHDTTRRVWLESRRRDPAFAQEQKDLEKLGILVTGFLQVKPWANSKGEDAASWQQYIMPYKDGRRKAGSLKSLLRSLVVRHQIEDIEAEVQLPPLFNRVCYLQPSWHDKLSINLFLLFLTANAVTSERVDEDYMFHPRNRMQLNILINNLRQSGFYWTSITPEDIEKTLKVSEAYLNKQDDTVCCSTADRLLLERAIEIGRLALNSAPWRSFAELHEMGVYVADLPEQAASVWSLVPRQEGDPLLTGATLLDMAQYWVHEHLYVSDLTSGLAKNGKSVMHKFRIRGEHGKDANVPEDGPSSKAQSPLKNRRITTERTMPRIKTILQVQKARKAPDSHPPDKGKSDETKPIGIKPALKSALKASTMMTSAELLPLDSPLAKTTLCGTASAKLSYLLDRITVLHATEKILVFYEGDQVAWYIAQALDLLDVRYLIYTKSLSSARQTAYITTFNKTETFRVLLMNVHQAAHGLHIASASRVFFVNPVWQPNVEAQAIKRAHRIGQTRPVYVETLVLKDTLEDQMLQRRKGMTTQEHQQAERSLLDDDTMSSIIKNAQFIPTLEDEIHDVSKQMAKIETSHQIFACPSKVYGDPDDADADLIFPPLSKKEKEKQERARERRIARQSLAF